MKKFRLIILLVFLGFMPTTLVPVQLHLSGKKCLGQSVATKDAVNSCDGIFGISDQDLFHWMLN